MVRRCFPVICGTSLAKIVGSSPMRVAFLPLLGAGWLSSNHVHMDLTMFLFGCNLVWSVLLGIGCGLSLIIALSMGTVSPSYFIANESLTTTNCSGMMMCGHDSACPGCRENTSSGNSDKSCVGIAPSFLLMYNPYTKESAGILSRGCDKLLSDLRTLPLHAIGSHPQRLSARRSSSSASSLPDFFFFSRQHLSRVPVAVVLIPNSVFHATKPLIATQACHGHDTTSGLNGAEHSHGSIATHGGALQRSERRTGSDTTSHATLSDSS
jgi:hypothetical protein